MSKRTPEARNNIRARSGEWHYRFNLAGEEHAGSTGLEATPILSGASGSPVIEKTRFGGFLGRSVFGFPLLSVLFKGMAHRGLD